MFNFFLGNALLRGLGSRKAHHFWKMEGIDLAKVVIGTPCNAYISEYIRIYKIKYISAIFWCPNGPGNGLTWYIGICGELCIATIFIGTCTLFPFTINGGSNTSCLHMFARVFSKKNQKRKLTGSSAQNIFGDPRYPQIFPGFPMVFNRFPREKKIKWIEVQTPPCLHTFRKVYVSSGAPHKAYRFNTPTINTFPASGTHTCLILRGYPP